MSFELKTFNKLMLDDIIKIWNDDVYNKDYLSKYSKKRFIDEVLNNPHFKKEGFKVIYLNNEILGYGLAVYNVLKVEENGYIPFIVIKKNYQRLGYGTKLLNFLTLYLKENNKKYIRQLFFDPINLKWNIKNTNNHIHPNTPGILYNSDYYLFLINNGFYIDGDNQNAYYLNIENFSLNKKLEEIEKKNQLDGYNIEIYNKNIHFGEKELFEELNNIVWYESFKNNIENENHPMLVITKKNQILGWTGPIYTKSDNRGYFAGIGVSKKIRNKGLGTLLFNKLILEFKNINVKYMSLFTGESNKARYIYERSGFSLVNSFAILRKDL